ncbi:MFS transporter [Clostridium chrysemydis]|uniref:MFS transporter n=1 Tax=Clostridium chrysemydis TaxID=2665504 RepID=UPI003F39B83F
MDIDRRSKINSIIFIISYVFMGVLGGVTLDTMVTFLDADPATKTIAAGMSVIMGIGFYGGAILLLVIPKFGYKKTLICSPVFYIIGTIILVKFTSPLIIAISASIVMIGVCMFDAILSPYLTCYTTEKDRDKVFSTTMWTNVVGMVIGTWSGGKLIALRFADRLHVSYDSAKTLTESVDKFNSLQLNAYVGAHRDALLIYTVVAVLCLIPLIFIKEIPADYRNVNASKKKEKINWKPFLTKYILFFIVFSFLIRFGASLITPYFSVFLSRMGIDRATTSALISYQYFAMVIFMMASPWIVKKLGRVGALGGLSLVSIPFMLIIANGAAFGTHMVMAVGLGLFFRSGFMNAASPVQQSLPMEFVNKEARPAYNAVIYVAQGLAQVVAGLIGERFIFNLTNGYGKAYYITAIIYTIACVMLLVIYMKKYNRLPEDDTEEANSDVALEASSDGQAQA